MISTIKGLKKSHPDFYEFVLFNLMSNVATLTNFCILWLGSAFLFKSLEHYPFNWFIFNYPIENGGLVSFLSFLSAYSCAQLVNFIVQRHIVFHSDLKISKVLPWYLLTIIVAGIISIWLPPYMINLVEPVVGSLAATVANLFNIMIQVAINYPMMKFVIMKKS